MTDREQPAAILRELLQAWPGYKPEHLVLQHKMRPDNWSIAYRTHGNLPHIDFTHLDINVDGRMCYLLTIGLDRELRGRGLGRQLYQLVEEFAKKMGCTRIELTPSGKTFTGDSRANYMTRLGYQVVDHTATKDFHEEARP